MNLINLANKLLLMQMVLVVFTGCQIVFDASPATFAAYVTESDILRLDPSQNSINGESCVASVSLSANSTQYSSWVSNNGFNITFNPSLLSEVGTYTLYFEITETQLGG